MKKTNNELIESLSQTIGTLVVLMLGTVILLGLAWVVVWLVKAILGL